MAKPIKYTERFLRNYRERIAKDLALKQEFIDSVDVFLENPAFVADHPLEDVMADKRAFSITDEYRVVYRDNGEYYLFLDVGTHDQVYTR